MANVCRLCLITVPLSSIIQVYKNHPPVEEQIKYLLPEIDMDLTSTLNLCNVCENLLQTAYSFVCTCRQTEETIKSYITQYNSMPVDLDEVQKFQGGNFQAMHGDSAEDIKTEIHNVEIKPEIPRIQILEQISAAFACHKCYKTFQDQQTFEQHQMGCSSFECNQYEEVLPIKKEHCPSPSLPMGSAISIDLPEVERSQIGNSTTIVGVPEGVATIPSQDLKIETEFVNVDDINLSDKCHEHFENETMENKNKDSSLISQKLEDPKVEPLFITVNSETDMNVGDQINATYNEHHKSEKWATLDVCQPVFTSRMELQNHNLINETSPEKYYNLTSPIQSKPEIDRPYKCQICGTTFQRKDSLTRHVHTKHDRSYVCEICDMNFNQKGHLTDHIKCKHELDRCYKCQTCGMSFKQKGTLKRHIQCRHGIDRPYKCQTCDMKFKRKNILANHIKCRHEIDRLYKCQTCSMNFKLKSHLRDHIKCRHEKDRPYKCQTCDLSFNRKSVLLDHIKYKHEVDRPYKCLTCSMSFTRKSNLTEHIKCRHTLDRPYKCQTCDMSFKRKSILTEHIKCKHEIGRPHKCQICDMSFKRKGTLTRHMQSKHETDRPYKCKICDKSFAVPRALKVHIETHTEPDENFSSVHMCSNL